MMRIIVCVVVVLLLYGCEGSKWPTVQNKTIVLGLELETMGNMANAEMPTPKLRAGLIFHEGQVVPPNTSAELTSDYKDMNLWTASGSFSGEMDVKPAGKE